MKVCVCGASSPDSARFCASCGKSLAEAEARPAAFASPSEMGFDPKWLTGPIPTPEAARALAWIGAGGAGLLFLLTLNSGWAVLASGFAGLILLFLLRLCIYGASTFALFRGWTIGGLASLTLHGLGLLQGVLAYNALLRAEPLAAPPLSPGRLLFMFLLWVVIPAALVIGIRGCMAWNRFRRGEIRPAAQS